MSDKEKVVQWMISKGYATGHGDTIEDLLKELEWQVAEAEKPKMRRATRKEKIVNPGVYEVPVHAIDISQERVDETAKREHEFEEMVKRGTKAWADTPDDWVDELRGGVEKREWVGLTDEERHELNNFRGLMPFIHAIEAKLKEKNT